MGIVRKIAERVYGPEAGEAREEEVRRVLAAAAEERSVESKRARLPLTEIPVGGTVRQSGRLFRCVERPGDVWPPSEACSGCSISGLYLGCGDLKCSVFDRSDGRDVWFVEVAE